MIAALVALLAMAAVTSVAVLLACSLVAAYRLARAGQLWSKETFGLVEHAHVFVPVGNGVEECPCGAMDYGFEEAA